MGDLKWRTAYPGEVLSNGYWACGSVRVSTGMGREFFSWYASDADDDESDSGCEKTLLAAKLAVVESIRAHGWDKWKPLSSSEGTVDEVRCPHCGDLWLGQDWWDGWVDAAYTSGPVDETCEGCEKTMQIDVEFQIPRATITIEGGE